MMSNKRLIFGIVLLFPLSNWGQTCDQIRELAKELEPKKDFLITEYSKLEEELHTLQYKLATIGVNHSDNSHLPLPDFDDSKKEYYTYRKLWSSNCKQRTGNWGFIKDMRQVNIDKYSLFNVILETEIDRLYKLLPENHERDFLPNNLEEENVLPNTFLEAKRSIFKGKSYSYCIINPKKAFLNLAFQRTSSRYYGFDQLKERLQNKGRRLLMATNAGMFYKNRQAVGLLIANNKIINPINRRSGKGNFYLEPNGVFGTFEDGEAFIEITQNFQRSRYPPNEIKLATQSGPMMVWDKKINPLFNPRSENLHFRNAVGILENGQIVFAISEQRVSFYEFSAFLLHKIACKSALYLDGTVSRMYLPYLNKKQDLFDSRHLGPILYIYE